MKYKNLFFDLDDTVWAFSQNARDTFEEVYQKYSYERYFDSFDHFYAIYQKRNTELWVEYGEGKITKRGLMPYAKELFEYLAPKYNLYILSNGFRELQSRKMRSAGVDGYFKKVILSEDLGVLKPYPEIFNFALSATQSELRESLMIGDSWEADITGAYGVGMHQVFYNVTERATSPFLPTYQIHSLKELMNLL